MTVSYYIFIYNLTILYPMLCVPFSSLEGRSGGVAYFLLDLATTESPDTPLSVILR